MALDLYGLSEKMFQPKGIPLTEQERELLLTIAKTEPQTRYQLEKGKIDEGKTFNHALVLRTFKRFEEIGILKGEKTEKGRITKTVCSLTLVGFCLAIQCAEKQDYKKIVRKWSNLEPLLLGKWDRIVKEMGLEEANNFIILFSKNLNDVLAEQKNRHLEGKFTRPLYIHSIFAAEATISRILDYYRRVIVGGSSRTIRYENELKEKGFYESLMREAKKSHVDLDNFQSIDDFTDKLQSSVLIRDALKWETTVSTFNELLCEKMDLKREKANLLIWMSIFSSEKELRPHVVEYQKELDIYTREENNFAEFLRQEIKDIKFA